MEYWDILDAQGNETGTRMKRSGFNHFSAGEYHLVVHIWIKNSRGEFLIQKRSPHKEPMAGEWAMTSGSAVSGETSVQAAVRELYEELGILVKPGEMHQVVRYVRKNSITDIWRVGVDAAISSLTFQPEEVVGAKWVSAEELMAMVQSGGFHNYGSEYFKALRKI